MWPGIPDTYQNLPESDSGSFRYTRSRDYQTPTRHALLGSGRSWKTNLCSIPLPVLATIVMWHGKKSVVRVAQRVAALVSVQGSSSLFPNMYCLRDPSSTFGRFSVQNGSGWPVEHMTIMRCMVSQCWFVLLRQTWCTLVSGERFASYGLHLRIL